MTLHTTVTIYWIDRKGREQDATVEVDYAYINGRLTVLRDECVGANPDDICGYGDLVWDALNGFEMEIFG